MADDQLGVKITADASGVEPGVEEAKSEISSLAPLLKSLNATMTQMAATMRTGFEQVASSLNGTKQEMKELEAETEREELSLRGLAASAHEGAEAIVSMKAAASEIAEVWLAAFGVEKLIEFSKEIAESAEKVFNLSQRLGVTTDDVQELQAMANRTGGTVEGLSMAMTRLDRAFQQAKSGNTQMQQGLAALGINANGSYTQMQLLSQAMAAFSEMPNGPGKNALALQTMGRAASEVIPTLNLTKEAQAELNQEIDEFGVKNATAVAAGMQLAEAWNTNKNATLGLKNVFAEELAPVMTTVVSGFNDLAKAFVQSYQAGGQAKTIMDGVALALKMLAEFVIEVGADFDFVFKTIDGGCWMLAGVVVSVVDAIVAALKVAWQAFEYTAKVVIDAFSLNWSAVVSDFKAGMAAITATALKGGKDAADAFRQGFGTGAAEWNAADNEYAAAEKFLEKLDKVGAAPKAKAAGAKTGTTDDIVATPKKEKGPSIVDQWKADLAEQLTAEQNWGADDAAFTLQFWESKLALVKKGSKDEVEVRQEVARAKMAVFKEEQQDELSTIRNTLAIKTDLAKTDNDLAKIGFQEKLEAIDEEQRAGVLSASQAATLRAGLNKQLYGLDVDLEQRTYELKLGSLQDELNLEHLKPQQREEINRQIEALEAQHLGRMAVLTAQNDAKIQQDSDKIADAIRSKWQGILQPIASAWGNAIDGIISKTQSLRQAWQSIGQALLQETTQWAEKQVVQWVLGETRKTAATAAGAAVRTTTEAAAAATTTGISATSALAQVAHSAAVAAARVYASIAQIPVVGPVLAPAAAAAALFAVIKLGQSVFSAENGMGTVPYDNAPFLLHKNEMVLPANLATPLRSMLQGGGAANINAPAAANDASGSGMEFHYHDHSGTMTPSQIMANRSAIAKAVKRAHREGAFAGTNFKPA